MKKISVLGILVILLGLGSCGKDDNNNNNTAPVVTPVATPVPTTTTATVSAETDTCVTTSSFSEFRQRVADMAFIKPSYTRENYYYYDCEEKEGRFKIDYNKCTISGNVRTVNTDLGSVRHEEGNTKEAVRDFLLGLIDNAVNTAGGGAYYDIKSPNGEWHKITLCQPLVANPTAWISDDEEDSYVIYGKSY